MKIENIETNKIKITFEVSPERLEEGVRFAYHQSKWKINIPGFRKGKVPRKLIEQQYGTGFFYEDAINHIFPSEYENIVEENNINVVSRPSIDVLEISPEKGIVFEVEVYVKPVPKIADYKGLTYEKFDKTVTEEAIDEVIQKDRDKNSRLITVTDRPVESGDILSINFEGFVNGEAFEGGKGSDYELTIGSKTFIDTFEEQLIGHNLGELVEVNVTFPENYHSEDLSGKPALFKVEIKEIKVRELPEADDEFAQDVSEFDTLAEYRDSIKEKLTAELESEAEQDKETKIMTALIEKVEVDIPESMIANHINQMINDFERRIGAQGLSLENYMKYVGQTIEQFRATYEPTAKTQVTGRLALEAVAANENFDISEQDLKEEIERMAASYRMEADNVDARLTDSMKQDLKEDIKVQKALKFVLEHAVEQN